MRSAWPASLGALFVIALTLSLLLRSDPLAYTKSSYGTLPGAYGALYDTLLLLEVPVERSFAAPEALPRDATVWWIDPDDVCAKLAAADSGEAERASGDPLDWNPAPWIHAGGTALVFAPALADCAGARRIGDLRLPALRLPAHLDRGATAAEADAEPDTPLLRGEWEPQQVTGAALEAPRSLPVPSFASFETAPQPPFRVVARVDGEPFALEASLGAGRLVLVADSVFLRNLWLDAGDAAPLAFDWVRAYGVPRLDEREHGLSDTPSTMAYLVRSPALPVFGGLAACGLLFALSGASLPRRRIGQARPTPPTLRSYVDSLARLYARTGDHADVFARYHEHGLGALRRALNLAHDAPTARVAEALAARPGVAAADVEALRAPPAVRGPAELGRACDAIDRLRRAVR